MNLGYNLWGTEEGLSKNIVVHSVSSEIIAEIERWDVTIRTLAQGRKRPFYFVCRTENWFISSWIDPNKKDALGREGYLACSIYFNGGSFVNNEIFHALQSLNRLYFEKNQRGLLPTDSECTGIISNLNSSVKNDFGAHSNQGKFCISGIQQNELSYILANALLGFSPYAAFVFEDSNVVSNNFLSQEFKEITFSVLAIEHNRLSKNQKESGERDRLKLEAAATKMRMVVEMTQKGADSAKVFDIINSIAAQDEQSLMFLMQSSEFSPYHKLIQSAREWKAQRDLENETSDAQRQIPAIIRLIKNHEVEAAEKMLYRYSPVVRNTLNEFRGLENQIKSVKQSFRYRLFKSKDPKDAPLKKGILIWSTVFGLLVLIGIGLFLDIMYNDDQKVVKSTTISSEAVVKKDSKDSLRQVIRSDFNSVPSKIYLRKVYAFIDKPIPSSTIGQSSYLKWDSSNGILRFVSIDGEADSHVPFQMLDVLVGDFKNCTELNEIFAKVKFKSLKEQLNDSISPMRYKLKDLGWINIRKVKDKLSIGNYRLEYKMEGQSNWTLMDLSKSQFENNKAELDELFKIINRNSNVLSTQSELRGNTPSSNRVSNQINHTIPPANSLSSLDKAAMEVDKKLNASSLTSAVYNRIKTNNNLSVADSKKLDGYLISKYKYSIDGAGNIKAPVNN